MLKIYKLKYNVKRAKVRLFMIVANHKKVKPYTIPIPANHKRKLSIIPRGDFRWSRRGKTFHNPTRRFPVITKESNFLLSHVMILDDHERVQIFHFPT